MKQEEQFKEPLQITTIVTKLIFPCSTIKINKKVNTVTRNSVKI